MHTVREPATTGEGPRRAPSNHATRQRAGNLAWACASTVCVLVLVQVPGGIWERAHNHDLHALFLPEYEYIGRTVLHGWRLPLWNPFEFCGSPLLASAQHGALYPPIAVLFGLLSPRAALLALYALHVLLLSWASVAYLRSHGLGPMAAALAPIIAVAQMFGTFRNAAVDHPNFLGCVAVVPFILLCAERAAEGRRSGWLALLALGVGVQWLVGYPDISMATAVLLAVVVVFRGGAPLARRSAVVVAGVGLGTLLAAVQLLPMLEGVAESIREEELSTFAGARRLQRLVYLSSLTTLTSASVALLLVPLNLYRPSRRGLAWCLAWVWCAVALLPPFSLLYELPGLRGVRIPAGWSLLGSVFLSFLAAAGVDAAWRRGGTGARRLATVLACAAAAGSAWAIAYIPASLTVLAPDYELVASRVRVLRLAVATVAGEPRVTSAMEERSGAPLRHGIPSVVGFEPAMPPRRLLRLATELGLGRTPRARTRWTGIAAAPDLAALLGVGVVVVPPGPAPRLREAGFAPLVVLPGGDVAWYRAPLPRVRIVHRVLAVADEEEAFARTLGRAAELGEMTVIEGDPGVTLDVPGVGSSEHARIVVDRPETLVVDVLAAAPAVLVVRDTFFPGWHATVDGEPGPILRADYAFRGVVIPAGRHEVAFRYVPRSLRLGAGVSATAAAVIVGLLVWARVRERGARRRPDAAAGAGRFDDRRQP